MDFSCGFLKFISKRKQKIESFEIRQKMRNSDDIIIDAILAI